MFRAGNRSLPTRTVSRVAIGIRVEDSAGSRAEVRVALSVRACQGTGDFPCFASAGGTCGLGTRHCADGNVGSCGPEGPSEDVRAYGPDCKACGAAGKLVGSCGILCDLNYADCDHSMANGCEQDLSSGAACTGGHPSPRLSDG
jgi:hypothetical protein